MKKVLSLILAVTILLSTVITAVVVSANDGDPNIKTTVIDLTQDITNIFATTGSTSSTSAKVEDGKLKISLSAYERHLTSQTNYSTQTWFPNFYLRADDTSLKVAKGNKGIVEVKYKVVSANANSAWGAQIGIGNWYGGKGSNIHVRSFKKHTVDDSGKEFTLTAVFTADDKGSIKIAFAGGGTIEISSVVVHELPASEINNYAVVKFVDNGVENTEFAKKNATLKTPDNADGFIGWYMNSEFSGDAVKSVSEDTTLYAKREVRDTNIKITEIDLTQNLDNFFATTGSTTATTAKVEDGKLKVHISAYERQLVGITSYNSQTWFPNYVLAVDGASFKVAQGNKAIVEVKYTVTGEPNPNHGTQIGIGNWYGGKGSNIHLRTFKKHTAPDKGKEFTLVSTFTADAKGSIKVAFSGGGDIEISSIVIYEIPAALINDYSVVTYVDGNNKSTEFVKKNTELKTPQKDEYIFDGWYADENHSGEKISSVTEDTTLYAKWEVEGNAAVINFHNGNESVTKKYAIGDKITETPTKEGYKFLGWYKYSNYVGRPYTVATEGIANLYAKWEEINPKVELNVDLTKNTSMITTGKTADSTINLNGDKLEFYIYNYERQLSNTGTTSDTWFPAYYLKDSNGNWVTLDIGTTYELEVTYKIVDVMAGDGTGLQIGFGADGQSGQTRTRIKGYKLHTSADEGKEFTYSITYTAERFNFGSAHYPKLLFSGQGKLEVTSVKIKKVMPVIKDTVIGVQDYEDYKVGTDTGVLGNKKGTEVSNAVNHTSGSGSKKSLKLPLNTAYARMSGNTIISLEQDGKVKPFATEKGSAYRVTFYMYANEDMNNLTWSVNSVDSALQNDYLKSFYPEVQDKVSLKKGEWKKIVAYIPVLKGTPTAGNLLAIAVHSKSYEGKAVYIDDVKVEQLVDSEVVLYNTVGGDKLDPQRAFEGQPFVSFKEPTKNGYLFDGWYYDTEYKNEAKVSDKFPAGNTEITLYAKWIAAPTVGKEFTAGSFDSHIYDSGVKPYENTVADMDSVIDFTNGKSMTSKVAWVKDAGVYGNGTAETDGALAFCNDYFSSYADVYGYNVVRLVNEDGTPFIAVKGERYTIKFDYIFASNKGLSYIVPIVSEASAYADIGNGKYQAICRVSVMETDTDYLTFKQSFVAERTGYVYLALTGRDDNAKVEAHCEEKVYVDNLSITCDSKVTKVVVKNGNTTWYTKYGVQGEKFVLPNAVKEGADTFDGFYLDQNFTTKFDGYYPAEDTTIYVKLKKDKYDTPSDFTNPITIDFEETELLEDFYRQQKYMTSWGRETVNEWLFITNDEKNALSGKNYIKLNGFSHYWNQAKFALYDVNHPENVMLLNKGEKYRVTVMVRCEDTYEAPINMTICLENPSQKYLLAENGYVTLQYTPEGDRGGYYMFVGDIEVSEEMAYYPSLAIRRNANDLQTLFIDTITVEQLRDCKVTYEENGGSEVEDTTVQIHDPVYDPGMPYKEGYVFDGWYTDKNFTKLWNFDTDTVECDMTLYAKWSVEVIVDEDTGADSEDENENGKAPNLLDADAVVIDKVENDGIQSWVIILICVGAGLVLVAAAFVVILLIRKRKMTKA